MKFTDSLINDQLLARIQPLMQEADHTVFPAKFSPISIEDPCISQGVIHKKRGRKAPFLLLCMFLLAFANRLHTQANPSLLVDFEHLDLDDITLSELVADILHALFTDL